MNEKRAKLESIIMGDDVVEYVSNLSTEELEEIFGKEIARMKNFDQKNPHHCYDLLGHTLHTIEGIHRDGLTDEQYKNLRIAALYHDVGKPDTAVPKKGVDQLGFMGHPKKSAEIAQRLLNEMGYSQAESDEILFYIGHHDDYMNYKTQIASWQKNHVYIREITPETVAEKMIENEYDLESLVGDVDDKTNKIRYICYTLAHGQEPEFYKGKKKKLSIDVNMDEVIAKIKAMPASVKPKYSLEQYKTLFNLCRADANAQSEVVIQDGIQISSRTEKTENINNVEKCSEEAMQIVENLKKRIALQSKEDELNSLESEEKSISEIEQLIKQKDEQDKRK